MSDIDWQEIHKKFSEAFRPEEIGTNQSNKGGGPYVDARSVAERLDAVVGPGAWMTDFRLIDDASGAVECVLTVHGVFKADIGYPNSVMGTLTKAGTILEGEPLKAAYSDAFKRAAVQWGIGRYLYPYPNKRKRQPGENGAEVNRETGEIRQASPTQTSAASPSDAAAQIIDNPEGVYRGDIPKASPYKPASPNQLATVAKLSRLLGHPEELSEDATSADASERITKLSHEYNQRKGG